MPAPAASHKEFLFPWGSTFSGALSLFLLYASRGISGKKGSPLFSLFQGHCKRNSSGWKEKIPFKIISKQLGDVFSKTTTGYINLIFLDISTAPLKLNKQPQIYFLGGTCKLEQKNRIFRVNYIYTKGLYQQLACQG